MPFSNNFVCKTAALPGYVAQENYKQVIQSVNLIIYKNNLTSTTYNALIQFLLKKIMRHHYSRVQINNL